MQRNTGYFPTESLEPSGNRLFSRSALNEGDLFRGSLDLPKEPTGGLHESRAVRRPQAISSWRILLSFLLNGNVQTYTQSVRFYRVQFYPTTGTEM